MVRPLPRIPYQRSLRKLLNRLTVIWLIIYVPALLFLAMRGEVWRGLQWLLNAPPWLLLLIGLHGLIVAAGWSAVAYAWLIAQRRQAQERIIAQSLADLQTMQPETFEAFVGQALASQGFKVWDIRFTVDHGVDLQLITPDGVPAIAQVKRYKNQVGEPAVRDLLGSMIHAGADRAFLISTGGFSEPAREWAEGKPITLIDGRQLLQMNSKHRK